MTWKFAILWMKITTWVVIIVSIPALVIHSFDPFYSLEGMILKDVYKNTPPDESSLIMYRFALGLFALLSIIFGFLQLYVIKYLIEKGDKNVIRLLFYLICFWIAGCTFLIFKFNTWSYFVSAGGMTAMWLPVLGWMAFTRKPFTNA